MLGAPQTPSAGYAAAVGQGCRQVSKGSPAGEGHTVVVVDDEPDILLLVEKILKRQGYDVVGTARDGQSGIDVVTEVQPAAVLLDLSMPRLDGASALAAIVRQAPSTMVAILSAHLDATRARELLMRGAFAAYDKGDLGTLPTTLSEDLAVFRRVLEGEDDVPAWQRRYRRL